MHSFPLRIACLLLLNAALSLAAPPVNDDFDAATILPAALPVNATVDLTEATVEFGEPDTALSLFYRTSFMPPFESPEGTVWLRWTPPVGGWVEMSGSLPEGASGRIVVTAFTGQTLGSLNQVWTGNRFVQSSRIQIPVTAGRTYSIQMSGFDGVGEATLTIRPVSAPSLNDDVANAEPVSGPLPLVIRGNNVNATLEHDEGFVHDDSDVLEDSDDAGAATVWFEWTCPRDGTYHLVDPEQRHAVSVWRRRRGGHREHVGQLSQRVGGEPWHLASLFEGRAGVSYLFCVASVAGNFGLLIPREAGPFTMELKELPREPNDRIADALPLGGTLPIQFGGSNFSATVTDDEPPTVAGTSIAYKTVWWKWTAPSAGTFRIRYEGSYSWPLTADVFVSNAAGLLASAANGSPFGALTFPAVAGGNYYVRVSSAYFYGSIFEGTLEEATPVLPPVPPGNDRFADAIDLGSDEFASGGGNSAGSTLEPGESYMSSLGYSVWWKWQAPSDGVWELVPRVDLPEYPGYSSGVYFEAGGGSAAHLFTPVQALRHKDDWNWGGRVAFAAKAGQVYHFRAVSFTPFTFELRPVAQPGNDDFANAVSLGNSSTVAAEAPTLGNTLEAGEPAVPAGATRTLWWQWTAPASGTVLLKTWFASSFAFTGSGVSGLTPVPQQFAGQRAVNHYPGSGIRHAASTLVFHAIAGTSYWLRTESIEPALVSLTLEPVVLPMNTSHATALDMGSERVISVYPAVIDGMAQTFWYKWTPPSDGGVMGVEGGVDSWQFATAGTLFRQDAGGLTKLSDYYVTVEAGKTYYLTTTTGFLLAQLVENRRFANDDFADREPLPSAELVRFGALFGTYRNFDGVQETASFEDGDLPRFGPVYQHYTGHSRWWTWRAPRTGTYQLFGATAWRGSSAAAVDSAGQQDTNGLTLFTAAADEVIHFAIAGQIPGPSWVFPGNAGLTAILQPADPARAIALALGLKPDSPEAALDANPSGDGYSNLFKYAFGLDPLRNSSPAGNDPNRDSVPRYVRDGDRVYLNFPDMPPPLPLASQFVGFSSEKSRDLTNWTIIFSLMRVSASTYFNHYLPPHPDAASREFHQFTVWLTPR